MSTTNCSILLTGLDSVNCLGANKAGGVDGVFYVGFRADLASVTFGTDGEITAMSMSSGKKLYKFAGLNNTHDIKAAKVKKGNITMFDQSADLILYPYTQAEVKALEAISSAKRMFLIYINAAGQTKAMGIDVNPVRVGEFDDERGLEASTTEFSEGKAIETENFSKLSLKGEFFNLIKVFKPASTRAANITLLDGLCA